jgi:hypothetical protein
MTPMPFQPLDVPNVTACEVFQALLLHRGEAVGGDAIFEEVHRQDGKHLFLIVDVMGHGGSAARLVGELREHYLPIWLHGQPVCEDRQPGELLTVLYELLRNEFFTSGKLLAAQAVLIDDNGVVIASNAGLPLPWLGLPIAGWIPWAVEGGPLLGFPVPDATYANETTTLPPGWKLLAFTDGVTEAGCQRQPAALFVNGPLEAFLAGLPAGLSAGQVVVRLLQALQIHARAAWPEDDTTVLCLYRH